MLLDVILNHATIISFNLEYWNCLVTINNLRPFVIRSNRVYITFEYVLNSPLHSYDSPDIADIPMAYIRAIYHFRGLALFNIDHRNRDSLLISSLGVSDIIARRNLSHCLVGGRYFQFSIIE